MTSRTPVVLAALVLLLGAAGTPLPGPGADRPILEVWKTPTCGCCKAWLKHVEDAGFRVRVTDLADVSLIKRQLKVPPELSSCHTAVVSGYVVEGHVPADDIVRMLKERPDIKGIYVPGMPIGSPGMEGPNGQRYDVLAVDEAGAVRVFATHQP
jgi:hypothetical protein